MALTRPKIWDLDTNIEYFMDPLTVLHQSSTAANVDVGFIFNRANGIVSNVALYWSESTGSFVTAFTSSDGTTNSNVSVSSYANLTIGSLITVNGAGLVLGSNTGINLNGSYGSSGQVLSSTGTGVQWAASGGFSGGPVPNQTTFASNLVASSGTSSTSSTTGALVVVGGIGTSGNVNIGGNLTVSNFLGNVFFGPTPTTTYYTQAPLNLTNSLAGGIKTQLNLINTGGGAGAGAGIDFYTYTSVSGSNYPEAKIAAVDDGNYSSYITFQTKIPGNTGANALAERIKIDSAGNIVIPTTTVSTSTTTGALVVAGGLGVAGAAYLGSVYDNSLRVVSTVNTTAGTGISLSGQTTTGPTTAVTITNSGVTGLSSSGTGNVTVSALTGSVTVSLSATGPGAATVGSSTAIPIITTDPYGRVSATSTAAVVAPAGTLSGSVLATGITTIGTSGSNLTASGSLVVSGNLYVQGTTTTVNTSLQTSNVIATTGLLVSGAYSGSYSDGILVDYVTGIGRFSVGTLDAISFYNNADSSRQLLGNLTYNGLFNLPISGAAYQISGTSVLNATTLGSGVTASSLTSVGTLTGLTVSGTIAASTNNNINIGSSGSVFATVYATTFSGVSTTAKYADLAERYTSDANYPAGTVVVFGGNKEITISTQNHDTTVAGVISTDPAYLMNSELDGVSVALTGRVPCQVQGPVRKGQVLVTSDTPGVAQRIDNSKFLPGCVVGKALESINTNTIETIEVVVGRF